MASIEEIRNAQRAKGPAGHHSSHWHSYSRKLYPPFRVTKSEHMTELKKFNRICKYIYSSMPNMSIILNNISYDVDCLI